MSVEAGKPPAGYGLDPAPYTVFPVYAKSPEPAQHAPHTPEPSLRANYVFDCGMHKFAGDKTRCARETLRRYDICARYDPHSPSLIHLCRIRPETGYALFGETTDILRINPAITSGLSTGRKGETPEEITERLTCYAYRAARPRPVQAVVDVTRFGGSKDPASPGEMRRRVYTLLGTGVKGLLYRDIGATGAGAAARNDEIRRINAEVNRLRPLLAIADAVPWAAVESSDDVAAYSLLAADQAVVLILVRRVPAKGEAAAIPTLKVRVNLPSWAMAHGVVRVTPAGDKKAPFTREDAGAVGLNIESFRDAAAYVIDIRRDRHE